VADAVFDELFSLPDKAGELASDDRTDAVHDGTEAIENVLAIAASSPINADAGALPESQAALIHDGFLFDFYYRIWVFPPVMRLSNPRVGVDIPFAIWNAFPSANTLETITPTNADALNLDLTPPSEFKPIEYREVSFVILPDAPARFSGSYLFTFDEGTGLFEFIVELISLVSVIPDVPVKETWSWLTDIIPNNFGNEQRMALRSVPRCSLQTKLTGLSVDEVNRIFDQQMFSAAGSVLIPYFQYATQLTEDAVSGATRVYFPPERTDMREGEYVLLRNDNGEILVKIQTLATTYADVDPLTMDCPKGTMIVPCQLSVIRDGSSIVRRQVNDVVEANVNSFSTQHRESFLRPGNDLEVEEFDGLPFLNFRPLANQNPEEQFESGTVISDGETGLQEIRTDWLNSFIKFNHQYLIRRTDLPLLDYWRKFLDTVRGRKEPFLTPTYRDDLVPAENPDTGGSAIKVVGTRYSERFEAMGTHGHLRLWTQAGYHDVKVIGVTTGDDERDLISFEPPLPEDPGWTSVKSISFITKVRLGSDDVVLDHYIQDSILSLQLRTVNE
jgi:hypothetical protein